MDKTVTKNLGLWPNLVQLKNFLHKLEIKPAYFIIPAALSLCAALFEGVSASLLIPIAKGVISMEFSFARQLPVIKDIIAAFPQFFAGNTPIFVLLAVFTVTTAITKNALSYFSSLGVAYQTVRFTGNIRKLIFSRYLSFGKLFFDKTSQGYLQDILLNFTKMIATQLKALNDLLMHFFMLVVYCAIMLAISWKLTLFAVIAFPLLHYSLRGLIAKIKKTSKDYADYHNRLSKKVFDVLLCIPLVKAYTREKQEEERFNYVNRLATQFEFSIAKKWNLIGPLQECIMLIVLLLFLSAIAFLIMKEKSAEVASLLVYFYIIRRATMSFGILNSGKAALAVVKGPIEKISEVLADEGKYFIVDGSKEFKGPEKSIKFDRLDFSYRAGVSVLKDINLCIEKGKITAIIGPTGAGKTTLINLLMRFYDTRPSSILIDGVDIREFTIESLRKHIALVSQEILLFNDTIRANITYGLDKVTDEQLTEATKKSRLYDFIMKLPQKFDTLIGDRGIVLSGGEKQRISIARALLKNPGILILDEATSALDTKTEKLIQEAIYEAVKGRTAIVIAHRLSTIKNANKIVVIEEGKLVEEGTLSELLDKRGKFCEYWNEQKFY
ncbi:MAG: ABC transporter ATP-binding protein [Candidatus Omnitrophica bacterium]|nr:ABC transporter ATP-binding protein [Candidatus Omnitrophota bacterium]